MKKKRGVKREKRGKREIREKRESKREREREMRKERIERIVPFPVLIWRQHPPKLSAEYFPQEQKKLASKGFEGLKFDERLLTSLRQQLTLLLQQLLSVVHIYCRRTT